MLYNSNHVLHYLLPDICNNPTYNLRNVRTIVFYLTKLDICQNELFHPDAFKRHLLTHVLYIYTINFSTDYFVYFYCLWLHFVNYF